MPPSYEQGLSYRPPPCGPQSPCEDCGVDTTPCLGTRGCGCDHFGEWEWYMVTDELWARIGMRGGWLCVACLERRLGRELEWLDFTDAPVNTPSATVTERLRERLSR